MSENNDTLRPTEDISKENPFRPVIVDLASEGYSWSEIHDYMEQAYNPIDKAAYEESKREVPIFEAEVVVHDANATSGKRYETRRFDGELTIEEAYERASELSGVIRVEHIEKVDTVTVV